MIEYKQGEGWILTGEDKIDLFQGEFTKEKILHAPKYPSVDLSKYTTYYFDSQDGYDEFDGLTSLTAKKSIEEAERICSSLTPNDKVRLLFKKGCTFFGNFVVQKGEPSDEYPLILDSYGDGDGYPKFFGDDSVLKIMISNIRVYNLEVTGPTAYRGIHVLPAKKA